MQNGRRFLFGAQRFLAEKEKNGFKKAFFGGIGRTEKVRAAAGCSGSRDCQKTMKCSFATESQGKSEGGKEPPSRSIKQLFKLFKFEKLDGQRGEKTFSTR